MTDKDSSPRIAALQELEAALDEHRRTQAEAGASRACGRARSRPVVGGACGKPGWRLPFNPWFLFDRRHPVMRKHHDRRRCVGRAACWSAAARCGGGCQRPDHARSCDALAHVGHRAEPRQPLSRRGRRHAARTRRAGAHGVAPARHRAARRHRRTRGGGSQGRGRHIGDEPAVRQPARREHPPGRCQHDDPHRSRRAGQRVRRRRPAVRHLRAGACAQPTPPQPQPPATEPSGANRAPASQPAQDAPHDFSLQAMAERGIAANVAALLAWIDVSAPGARWRRRQHRRLRRPRADRDRHHQWQSDHRRSPQWPPVEVQADQPQAEPAEAGRRNLHRAVGEPGTAMGAERSADAGSAGPPASAASRRARSSSTICWRCACRKPGFVPTRWCRPRSNPTSRRTARRRPSPARSSRRAARSADPDDPEHQHPDQQRRVRARLGHCPANAARAVQDHRRRRPLHAAFGVRRARAARRQLDVRRRRRLDRARSADAGRRRPGAQARRGARQHRSGPSADHDRARRFRHQGARRPGRQRRHRRAVRQARLRRRAAARHRASPATRCRPARSSACGRSSSPRRFATGWCSTSSAATSSAIDIATNAHDRRAAARRAADSRGGPVGRDRRQLGDAAPGRGTAADPRRRLERARHRAHRQGHARQGHVDVSPGRRLTVSNGVFEVPNTRPKTPPARVGFRVDGPVPGRRRTAGARPLARIFRRAVRSRHARAERSARRSSSACRCVPICRKARPTTTSPSILSNFTADKMLFGQKVEAQTLHVSPTTRATRSRATSRSRGAPASVRVPQGQRRDPTPRSACRRRSTTRRARGSASISAIRSPARCR